MSYTLPIRKTGEPLFNFEITRGQGATVDTSNGPKIDCVAGIAVMNLGYNHPGFQAAIQRVVDSGVTHASSLYDVPGREELAEKLAKLSPTGEGSKVFFSNSGAEANGALIKAAAMNYGSHLAVMQNGFHGRIGEGFLATVKHRNNPLGEPYKYLSNDVTILRYNNLNDLEKINHDTYAVIVELVQGESGIIPATQEYVTALRERCNETGTLLLVDEIQTGIGRTGTLFACEQYGLQPDGISLAKALGNGIAVGATIFGPKMHHFRLGEHGSTFGGNPLAMAAGNAVIDAMQEERPYQNAATLESMFKEFDFGTHAGEKRGIGAMLGLELPDTNGRNVVRSIADKGALVGVAGGGKVLRFTPPLVITEEQFEEALNATHETLEEFYS